jgi:hypothetical protein
MSETVHILAGNVAYAPITDVFAARCTCGETALGWSRSDALDRLTDHQVEATKAAS